MYNFQTRCEAFIQLNPIAKFIAFFAANAVMFSQKSYICELAFFSIIFLTAINGKIYKAAMKYTLFYLILLMIDISLNTNTATAITIVVIVARFLRMFTPIIFSAQVLISTTSTSEFISAFQKIRLPMSFIIPFAVLVRFIPTVKEEAESINHAMSYRGIKLNAKSVICHPIKVIEYILVPLVISSVNVMDELAAASMTRGLNSEATRTSICDVRLKIQDAFLIIVFVAFVILVKGGYMQ